jgi:succinate-semialdehyde dehydrogenase/glutarate-semialdehyde dehydrogenase
MSTATAATVTTIDPATGETLASYAITGEAEIDAALARAVRGFRAWRTTTSSVRSDALRSLATTLRAKKSVLAELATREMGKTIVEAEAEVEKCAIGCEHYAEHGPAYLADEPAASSATESYVAFRPLGVLLAIMPWNFPFWQLFRAAAPAIAAGNVVLLKHAANVTGCALAIADVFREAGLPEGTFATIVVAGRDMERVVADPRIAAVTLTGSEGAGSSVASIAGKHLKKTVLELGGSDAFIVLADADIAAAAKIGVRARFQNNGQSCIAAKRFIVESAVYDAFCEAFVACAKELVVGNPLERTTTLGPVARGDLRDGLDKQVRDSVARGGRLALGGSIPPGPGSFYDATIVADVAPGMPVFDEETFGPVAAIMRARDADDAVELANASPYGLGGNLWTQDIARAKELAARCESGAVFINGMTASDPRLPFGGVKLSGYGRELAAFGIREFVNVQTIWIGPSTDTSGAAPSE